MPGHGAAPSQERRRGRVRDCGDGRGRGGDSPSSVWTTLSPTPPSALLCTPVLRDKRGEEERGEKMEESREEGGGDRREERREERGQDERRQDEARREESGEKGEGERRENRMEEEKKERGRERKRGRDRRQHLLLVRGR